MSSIDLSKKWLRVELLIVLLLGVGLSALRSILAFSLVLAQPEQVSAQRTTLNGTAADGHPWIDLGYQLVYATALVLPACVALLFLAIRGEPNTAIGLTAKRLGRQFSLGMLVAAVVGGIGLAVYLFSYSQGWSLAVVPTQLESTWWRIPVLVIYSVANAILEEIILAGYAVHRMQQLGSGPWSAIGLSAIIRAFYHLYQGAAGFFGNLVMGVVFAGYFQSRRTVVPQIVAHAAIDITAFVGYLVLAPRVDWLPG